MNTPPPAPETAVLKALAYGSQQAIDNPFPASSYLSPPPAGAGFSRIFPSLSFYWAVCAIVGRSMLLAKKGKYDDRCWVASSLGILAALEQCGIRVSATGLDHVKTLDGPCVFIANHMSTLETFVLPGMIQPYKPVTFVVKESLLNYPFFRHVMRARKPIAVARRNPREDLATVLTEGAERLDKGQSIIIFPQSTRNRTLDPQQFNSLGVKLARKAGVPALPLALRTDAWGMGGVFGLLKDYGRINPGLEVHFSFGEPVAIAGNGKAEHAAIYDFIRSHLLQWGLEAQPLPSGGAAGNKPKIDF